jgi:2-polyprenyl-3-methyl-5-hydroxy-6-metoxy-1,4-benzoquinol methylase
MMVIGGEYGSASSMKKHLARLIPNSLEPIVKQIYWFLIDITEELMGRFTMIPPRSTRSMVHIGGGDFKQIGQEFKNYFITLANLQPNNRVLDVGCGIGRMAIPLTSYLSKGCLQQTL